MGDTPPVVGVGASAGGLEAFTQLLGDLPIDTGMAYLLVQHLDPTHASALVELLARSSSIPVLQASDGMRVDANQAYVIPPNTAMTLVDGHVRLVPRDKTSHPPTAIDEFFRSVAAVRGNRAVGIVLSGSGSDGALGVEAIRSAGGITLVQEPSSAAYDSMPLAAIATGCADFILPPKEIAGQMARIGRLRPPPSRRGSRAFPDCHLEV
jgi:two-component system, chemotaxis family, CheB/CheR fusion protein